ncbi:MAG TPA: glycosyltransferase family 4 protein [Gaiellaceae bacterium]
MSDLAVVGQDPGFGGGSAAQMEAFLAAARALGREPELLYVPHPSFHRGLGAVSLDRVEFLRLLRGSRALVPRVTAARSAWVVAPLAMHGLAAALSGRPYACWAGASLAAENDGRRAGLPLSRRLAMRANAPALARIERRVLAGAARVYAMSPSSRDELARAGDLDPATLGILPLPVDAERFAPEDDARWLARLDAPVVAFVGRGNDPRKNLALALEALPLLRRRVPSARLRVIGPGAPAAQPGIEPLGEVVSVAEPLREASLLLLPSRQEAFAIVAAEALACGVPVVSTPNGGPEALLRESGGGHVLSGFAAAELAGAAADLLEAPDTLAAMRQAGRAYVVREHSPEHLRRLLAVAMDELDAHA